MAKIVTDENEIVSFVEDKQTNEQEMVSKLYNIYDKPEPRRKIRQVVISGLTRMLIEKSRFSDLKKNTSRVRNPVIDTLKKEKRLAVWRHVKATDPEKRLVEVLHDLNVQPSSYDIGDLSNLIRVIGGWIESGGGFGNVIPLTKEQEKLAITEAFRPGLQQDGKDWDAAKAEIWDKTSDRQRENRITNPARYHKIPEYLKSAWKKPPSGYAVGLQMFRVNGNDLMKKIDLIFGLLKGATISGTTTDTAMVLEVFGAQHKVHSGYYLFPVATIAGRLHHTLLEAGLALTLIGALNNYSVGFYKTLEPKGGLKAELKSVRELLDKVENDDRNRHFMIWYNDSERPAGCILWDKSELNEVKNKICDGKRLLQKMRSMPIVPRRNDIVGYINETAPNLLSFDLKRKLFSIS